MRPDNRGDGGEDAPSARSGSASATDLPRRAAWTHKDTWVAVLGLVLFVAAQAYLQRFGTAVAFHDDLTKLHAADRERPLALDELWIPHNEHRIPLPLLVFESALRWTGDFRATTLFDLWILALAAFGLTWAARRARGRASLLDAFLPLTLFSLAQAENLLNGFQVALVLPAVLACAWVVTLGSRSDFTARRRVVLSGILGLALALCGAFGLVMAGCVAAWLAWIAATRPGVERRLALGFVIGLVSLGWAHVRGLDAGQASSTSDPGEILAAAGRFLCAWTGDLGRWAWPWSGALAAIVFLGCCASTLAAARRDVRERDAWLGFGAVLLGMGVVACLVGVARGRDAEAAGSASRYATISAVGAVTCYLVAARRAGLLPRTVRVVLCLAAIAGWIGNLWTAQRIGAERVGAARRLERAVHSGIAESRIAAIFGPSHGHGVRAFARALGELDRLGLAPFYGSDNRARLRLLGQDSATGPFFEPQRVTAPEPPARASLAGFAGLGVAPGTELAWRVPPRGFSVRGRFGIERALGHTAGTARFTVEVRDAFGAVLDHQAFEIGADAEPDADPLRDFGLLLEDRADATLVLSFDTDAPGPALRGFWADVRLR